VDFCVAGRKVIRFSPLRVIFIIWTQFDIFTYFWNVELSERNESGRFTGNP